jgi:membrane-bound metal-dependent hydrolase YbcI (DUF457 family)
MMGRTHLATGVCAGAVLALAAYPAGVPDGVRLYAIPVAAWAVTLPDLDHRNSIATYSLGPVTMAISWLVRRCTEHRGRTHRVSTGLAVGVAAAVGAAFLAGPLGDYWWYLGLAVALGWCTHIAGDARTLSGVPWRDRTVRLGVPFRTGSPWELAVEWPRWRRAAFALGAAAVLPGPVFALAHHLGGVLAPLVSV